jgi:1,4-dihydroxy-2-naphthoyl-CoA synthase
MTIDYDQDGHVVTITINRPEAHNALDMHHFRDLLAAWTRFRDDESALANAATGEADASSYGCAQPGSVGQFCRDRLCGWPGPTRHRCRNARSTSSGSCTPIAVPPGQ